jgi:hypothetical protein
MNRTDLGQPFLPGFAQHCNRTTCNVSGFSDSNRNIVRPVFDANLPPDNTLSFSSYADTFHQLVRRVDFPVTYQDNSTDNRHSHGASLSSIAQ